MLGYSMWKCADCKAQLPEDVYPCPLCPSIPQQEVLLPANHFTCLTCTFQNPSTNLVCDLCGAPRQGELPLLPDEPKVSKKSSVTCPHCNQDNDLKNESCVYCQEDLFGEEKKMCDICNFKVKGSLFNEHYKNCLMTSSLLLEQEEERKRLKQEQEKWEREQAQRIREQESKAAQRSLEECIHCRQKFLPEMMKRHLPACRERSVKGLEFDPRTRMTPLQMKAMKHMTLKCQTEHNTARAELQKRILKLGYTLQDLNNLQFYTENYAPIIIHIHISKHMQFFINDTHYRSQFETNKSSGSLSRQSRTTWENRMFDNMYNKATDFERVKYGVINFTNDPKGVGAASSYGPSYFLLKEHVRERCTFADQDSSSNTASIGTLRYCFKILNKMNDAELKGAMDASKAKEIASSCTRTYKEMQIHGPIQFNKDIQRIYVNRNEIKGNKKLLDMVYDFSKQNGVEHDFI